RERGRCRHDPFSQLPSCVLAGGAARVHLVHRRRALLDWRQEQGFSEGRSGRDYNVDPSSSRLIRRSCITAIRTMAAKRSPSRLEFSSSLCKLMVSASWRRRVRCFHPLVELVVGHWVRRWLGSGAAFLNLTSDNTYYVYFCATAQ